MSIRHRHIEAATSRKKPDPIRVLENAIHIAIAKYLNTVIKSPSRWWTIEVSNQASGKAAMLRQMALKRKGVLTGTPDIQIIWQSSPVPNMESRIALIFLEVKAPDGKLTEKQESLHDELRNEGHYVSIVRSVTDVEAILKQLGVI